MTKFRVIKFIMLLVFFGFSQNSMLGQELISSEYLTNISKASLEAQYPTTFKNGVDLYRVIYMTPNIEGIPDTASGLLVIPDDPGFAYPLLVYQHGTVNSREDVPSNLAGGYQLATVFGGQGYVTVAPDYLGLGVSPGIHPYVHADTEASVAIDMLFATREFAEQNDFVQLNDQLFVTGYSQGGHAAMAAHRALELDYSSDFTVTAAAPMSGPYSVSDKMIEFTLSDTPYDFVSYIVWTALSYNMAYDNLFTNLDEFFKPNYVPLIEQFANETISLGELNDGLIDELLDEVGTITPKNMLQDSILNAILNEPTHPVSQALADNDLHDWTPQAPTRILYCTADDQVYYQNAVLAATTMNDNGAEDVLALDISPGADHGACVTPAVSFAILFFNGLQDLTVATQELTGSADDPYLVTPVPVKNRLLIEAINKHNVNAQVELYDMQGQLILRRSWTGQDILQLDLSEVNDGLYFLMIDTDQGRYTRKLTVH